MKLYYSVPSSASRRCLIVLALKGVTCRGERVDLHDAESVRRHAQRHPLAQVPVLEVDTPTGPHFISQSVAIAEYLEECYPTPALLGDSALRRAQVREIVELVSSGMQPLHNVKTLQRVEQLAGPDAVTPWMADFTRRGLQVLEHAARASQGPYMTGSDVTLADVFVVAQLGVTRRMGVFDETEYPALIRVEQHCLARRAFADPPLPH